MLNSADQTKEASTTPAGPDLAGRYCLIVDDSPTVRKVARRIMTGLQFEIEEAEHGGVAMARCAARLPDVVLLDWNMPTMNGIEFLQALRTMDGGKTPWVVLCTTEGDVNHIRTALAAGADDYIIKPFDAGTLRGKLGRRASSQTN